MPEKKDDLALLTYLDGVVEDLRQLASRAVKGRDVDAVHDARVATRRLKAALDLLQTVVTRRQREPFAKITRLLRRRLSTLRDLDVMLQHLSAVKSPKLQPAALWMTARLEKSRHKAAAQAAADLPAAKILARLGAWWGLREQIAAANEAVASLLAESIHLQLDGFAEQASLLIQETVPSDPHDLRVAGKSLRYTLEMAKAHGIKLPRPVLAAFKRIQTALALWHDDVVLTETLLRESADQQRAHHDPLTQQAILWLASVTLRRAQGQLAKVADFWRHDGPALVEQIRRCFPLTVPIAADPAPAPAEPIGELQPIIHEAHEADTKGHEEEKALT
jgi:CHAD domain-containing protein